MAQATRITLSLLAQRIEHLTGQIDDLNQRLTRLLEHHAPQLLTPVGIGPDSAVTLLIAMGDNLERVRTEASFAALCGVSPVEYSSGNRSSRRLNHGGDRQANAALHRIVFTRLRHDPRTQAYYERRTQEGKTRREIIRCLKRYAAREVFNLVKTVSSDPLLSGRRVFLAAWGRRGFCVDGDLVRRASPACISEACPAVGTPSGSAHQRAPCSAEGLEAGDVAFGDK
ncbi:transposase [Streptomyces sp. NPDC086554]|uniref:transposase n=1 Tax=Streptomyces sp. NPDC086554 TaxID=3154864 RepID=UPI00341FBEA1